MNLNTTTLEGYWSILSPEYTQLSVGLAREKCLNKSFDLRDSKEWNERDVPPWYYYHTKMYTGFTLNILQKLRKELIYLTSYTTVPPFIPLSALNTTAFLHHWTLYRLGTQFWNINFLSVFACLPDCKKYN